MKAAAAPYYRRPGRLTRLANRLVGLSTRAGISVLGSRVLETKGRSSGLPRRTPVNLLTLDGTSYLVSPRGETDWVRNVRAGGGSLALLLGRRRTEQIASELAGDERLPVLRAYLRRWGFEVGVFFDGVGSDSSDHQLRAIADRHPVFALTAVTSACTNPGTVCSAATTVTSRPASRAVAAVTGPMQATSGGTLEVPASST